MLFIEYPKCSTCKKAKKWLDDHNIKYEDRHIIDDNPTFDELKEWYHKSNLDIKRFFNTSGMLYKEIIYRYANPFRNREVMYAVYLDVEKIEENNDADFIFTTDGQRHFVAKEYIGRQVVPA